MLSNVYQVIGITKIVLEEDLSTLLKLKSEGDEWRRISILYRDIIETSKVDGVPKVTILHSHIEEATGK